MLNVSGKESAYEIGVQPHCLRDVMNYDELCAHREHSFCLNHSQLLLTLSAISSGPTGLSGGCTLQRAKSHHLEAQVGAIKSNTRH